MKKTENLKGAEIKALRSAYGKAYDLGREQYRYVMTDQLLHGKNSRDEWYEIDNNLEKAGKAYRTKNSPYAFSFGDKGNPYVMRAEKEGFWFSWSPLGERGELSPEITSGKELKKAWYAEGPHTEEEKQLNFLEYTSMIAYPDIQPGVTCVMQAAGADVQETITVNSKESLSFLGKSFTLSEALSVSVENGNTVLREEGTGREIFCIGASYLRDSKGECEYALKPVVEKTDTGFTLDYDFTGIDTESLSYPVTVDPEYQCDRDNTAIKDTTIKQASPNTNYGSSDQGETGILSGNENRFLIRIASLPAIPAGEAVVSSVLKIAGNASDYATPKYISAHEMTGSWEEDAATWNNSASLVSETAEDFVRSSDTAFMCFDITRLTKKWMSGDAANNGICLRRPPQNDGLANYQRLYTVNASSAKRPVLVVDTVSHTGIASRWTYDSMSAGRTGSASVDLYNGSVHFSHGDTGTTGEKMPVTVSHHYNSTVPENLFGCGYGWKTNWNQRIREETIGDRLWFVWEDGTGNEHWFKKQMPEAVDAEGQGLRLRKVIEDNVGRLEIRDKKDTVSVFVEMGGAYAGEYYYASLRDVFNNTAVIAYDSAETAKRKPVTVTDGAGRVVTFTYDNNGKLTAISTPVSANESRTETYAYSAAGDLASMGYHDIQEESAFTYTNHLLTQAEDPYGTKAEISYDTLGRAESLEYGSAAQEGAKHVYTYLEAETIVKHVVDTQQDTGKEIVYRFNETGNLISVRDELGHARSIGYAETFENKPEDISSLQSTNANLLRHPDHAAGWTVSGKQTGDAVAVNTSTVCNGTQSMRVKKTSTTGTIRITQSNIPVETGKTYTFSAYAAGRVFTNAEVYIEIKGANDADWKKSAIVTATITGNEDATGYEGEGYAGWRRLCVRYTAAASQNVQVREVVSGGVCEIFFACPQLEEGEEAGHVNLISNGEFRYTTTSGGNIPTDWTLGEDTSTGTGYGVIPMTDAPQVLEGNCFKFLGKPHKNNNYLLQEIQVKGSAGDEYVLSGWVKAKGVKADGVQDAGFRVQFWTGSTWSTSIKCMYDVSEGSWQYQSFRITAPANYTKMLVMPLWRKNINEARFAEISLNKESYGSCYAYDANGNTTGKKNKLGKSSQMTYDSYDNLTSYVKPGHPASAPITIEYGDGTFPKYHLPVREKSSENIYIARGYHEGGVQTNERRIVYEQRNDPDPTMIRTETGYTSNWNYAVSTKDARGKISTRTVNAYTGLTESAQGPVGSPVVYAYDDADRLTEVKAEIETGREAKNAYTYQNDRLTEISHNTTGTTNDVKYTLEYDSLGNNTAVKVITGTNPEDEVSLVQRTFTNDRRRLPLTETTGNGSTVSFAYDDFGRITSRTVDSDPDKVVSYQYGKDGRLEKTANTETGRTERIRYDLAGREMSRETKDANGNTVHAAYAAYDEAQNVSTHVEKLKSANGTLKIYKTRYVYDRDDRIAATLFGEDADTTRTTLIYDGLGRVTNRKTYNGSSCTVTESYTYAPGYTGYSANATTDLITGMSQTGMVQSYTYDDNGRISSWVCNNKKCSYEYDAIGQLIRVNDEKDTQGHSTGTTWVYEYDNGGNILARKRYVYTEGTLPAVPDNTDTWTYHTGWKDKLYTFNNSQIVSDTIGNILSDGTWSYTWEGRKLTGMTDGSKTISFLYNENGQRIRKAVTENGNTVTTEYVVSGKSVTHVIQGTEDLHIFYANGQPSHCKYGNSMYTYVYSLQGDVLGLKDNTGALVVTYLYDAWGNIIQAGGSLANTLGVINPFRYRGYVYDTETVLYYLRSRYYDPEKCRFISSDSILGQTGGLLQHNLFCYCLDSPQNNEDSNGNLTFSLGLIACAAGAFIGAAVQLVSNVLYGEENVFDGVIGAAIGGAVYNFVALTTWNTGIAAYASAAAESASNEAIDYITGEKDLTFVNITDSVSKIASDTLLFGSLYYTTGKIADNVIKINIWWAQPKHIKSAIFGKYGGKVMKQTLIQGISNFTLVSPYHTIIDHAYEFEGD